MSYRLELWRHGMLRPGVEPDPYRAIQALIRAKAAGLFDGNAEARNASAAWSGVLHPAVWGRCGGVSLAVSGDGETLAKQGDASAKRRHGSTGPGFQQDFPPDGLGGGPGRQRADDH